MMVSGCQKSPWQHGTVPGLVVAASIRYMPVREDQGAKRKSARMCHESTYEERG